MISANAIIENALSGITLNQEAVAVAFAFYEGRGEPYIVYSEIHKEGEYSADDLNEGFFSVIDVEVYSRTDYIPLLEEILTRLENAGFIYEPNKDSGDLYDPDTKYFHKTLCFSYPIQRAREANTQGG